MLDVLQEDPELGVVLKCDEAALSGGAHLSEGKKLKAANKNRRVPAFTDR